MTKSWLQFIIVQRRPKTHKHTKRIRAELRMRANQGELINKI